MNRCNTQLFECVHMHFGRIAFVVSKSITWILLIQLQHLTVARDLAPLGYQVTVLDQDPQAGGMTLELDGVQARHRLA